MATLMMLAAACKKDKDGPDGNLPVPKAVDIGLVLTNENGEYNLKWASFNLGASNELEYGDYYAWGEISAKEDYTWDTYKFANGENKLTKYCPNTETAAYYWDVKGREPDGLTVLQGDDDVARKRLGRKWRMPTKEEFSALLALKDKPGYKFNKWEEMKDAQGNSVYGLKITRESTGSYLFFPAAGYGVQTTLGKNAGSIGRYWSSSVSTGLPVGASALIVMANQCDLMAADRYYGYSVRPVCEE